MSRKPSSRRAVPFTGMSCNPELPSPANPLNMMETLSSVPALREVSKPGVRMRSRNNDMGGPENDPENAPTRTPLMTLTLKGPSR